MSWRSGMTSGAVARKGRCWWGRNGRCAIRLLARTEPEGVDISNGARGTKNEALVVKWTACVEQVRRRLTVVHGETADVVMETLAPRT